MYGISATGLTPGEGWWYGLPEVSSSVGGSSQQGHCPYFASSCVSPRHERWQLWPQLSVWTGCSAVGPARQ
eukprot:6244660-Heterocapsa_arctica.AAC.1